MTTPVETPAGPGLTCRHRPAAAVPSMRQLDLRDTPVVADACDDVRRRLESLAEELRDLWAGALERGDVEEATRLVDASHAVHRAVLAMREDAILVIGGNRVRRRR